MTMRGAVLVAATLATGLMAGLFFTYTNSVLPGLARTDDRTMVGAMQQMNRSIQNGWFFLIFMGALVLTAVAAGLHLGPDRRSVLPWTVAALVLYALVLGITFRFSIPLNDELDGAGAPDQIADLAAVRERFEQAWVRWNVVRTLGCTAAFGCLCWALVLHGRLTAR